MTYHFETKKKVLKSLHQKLLWYCEKKDIGEHYKEQISAKILEGLKRNNVGISNNGSLIIPSNTVSANYTTACINAIPKTTTTASGGIIGEDENTYELYRKPLYIEIRGSQRLDSIFTPSVYLLTRYDEVVYVGQSINPVGRMYTHKKDKEFDGFRILKCREDRMLYWEGKLINYYQPEYNKTGWR